MEVAELEIIFSRIIDKLKSSEPSGTIELETDLYRFIPADKWQLFAGDHILNGSLYDDIDSLKQLVEGDASVDSENYHPTTFVDFDRLAFVLMAISQQYNPPGED